ncbi:MAG: putative ABC exporter domain-containing protein [Planctomycetota bacterium]
MNAATTDRVDRTLFPRALRLLVLLRYKAHLRRIFGLNTKRLLFTIAGFCMMGVYVVPHIIRGGSKNPFPPDQLARWLPVALLAFVASRLVFPGSGSVVTFSPAEVDLVLPGPFSRKQLVLYQVLYMVGPLLLMSLWMAVFVRGMGSYLRSVMMLAVVIQFVQLMNLNVQALRDLAAQRMRMLAITLAALIVGLLAFACVQAWSAIVLIPKGDSAAFFAYINSVRDSAWVNAVLSPFTPHSNLVAAQGLVPSLSWFAVCMGMNIVLMGSLVVLDSGQVEALVIASQKKADKLARMKQSGRARLTAKSARRRVAMLPRWGGVGPIAWRQVVGVYRWGGPVLFSAVAVLLFAGFYAFGYLGQEAVAGFLPIPLVFTVFLSGVLRIDFRGDLDHLAQLKTLPISERLIAIGQLATPVAVLTLVQAICIAGLAAGSQSHLGFALAALGLTIPLNTLLLSIDNAVFLFAPTRPNQQAQAAGFDPTVLGRTMILTLVKLLTLAGVALVVGGPGFLVYWLTESIPLAVATGGVIMTALMPVGILIVAESFRKFDPATDMPS